jgi:hypothetical protein
MRERSHDGGDRVVRAFERGRSAAAPLAMPDGALLLFDAAFPGPASGLEAPFELGGLYAMAGWTNGGAGPDVLQATGTKQPSWSPGDTFGDWSGIPFVHFGGDDGFAATVTESSQDFTVYSVARGATNSGGSLWDSTAGRLLMRYSNPDVTTFDGTFRFFAMDSAAAAEVLTTRFDAGAGQTRLYAARAEDALSPLGYTPRSLGGTFGLGANGTVTGNFLPSGYRLHFFALYPEAHDAAQRAAAWGYLESRFPAAF